METWNRSRFQLTVHKTRNIRGPSKTGLHDVYVVVSFGKEKHKTSIKERCHDAQWDEDCFFKLLSTNEDTPVKVKVCHRNFFLLHDESIGSVEIHLKRHQFYEEPKQSWFTLTNKFKEEVGEILVTLSYLAITPVQLRPTLKKSTSFKSLADRLGHRLSLRKENDLKNISLSQLPRNGSSANIDLNIFTESFKGMFQADSSEDVAMRKAHHIPSHRHTIDFTAMADDRLYKVEDKRNSSSKLKSITVTDSNLTRFDSFDSLNDKKAFEDSISSSEESILNYANDVIRLDDDNDDGDVDDNDDVFMAQLNRFTKQELVQLVKDQKEWIKSREVYIIDLHTYVNSLLMKILNTNCSLLQKNSQTPQVVDECHKLTTFKNEETSTPKKWIRSLFGPKQKS